MIPRILMVDDDENALMLYSAHLRSQSGWEIVTSDNGKDALKILDPSFHAVVLDEMMPSMRGMQILQEIRSRPDVGSICVVMLSGTDDPDIIANTFDYKPNAYLRKTKAGPRDLYIKLARELSGAHFPSLRPIKVFLCHSHEDKPAVRELYYRLKRDFVDPWLDEVELVGGQDWDLEIKRAVRSTDIVVVCLSRHASSRGFLHKEIGYALDVADEQPEGGIFVIPLLLEPCGVPSRLARWQWIDSAQDGGYERLLRSVYARRKELGLI
jgi:CheY-like chemotaxis protein